MIRRGLLSALVVVVTSGPQPASAAPNALGSVERELLTAYARDTWHSFEALTGENGLPADGLCKSGDVWTPMGYTSPTDVAAYLWSALAAEELGIIPAAEANRKLARTLASLGRLERSNGFFYNWYDPHTGAPLRTWPGGGTLKPFVSTVDNGWLAAALIMVENAKPELRGEVESLLGPMNFGFLYDAYDAADPAAHPGLLRGGYWPDDKVFATFHYGMLNTEARIASYIGISRGHLPADHYYRMSRGGNAGGTPPIRIYSGVPVAEGSISYRGSRLVPSWNGTMFEALMVPLFVPEATWGESSWGVNHAMTVRAQIEYGLRDCRIGYWGISASCDPKGGYYPYGIAALGLDKVAADSPSVIPGVVTPHAAFLALPYAPTEAMANLRALASAFPIYGSYGFHDAVDVRNGKVSDRVLAVDQGMILASIANVLSPGHFQKSFCSGAVETFIRPLIAPERFVSGMVGDPSSSSPEVNLARVVNAPPDLPRESVPIDPAVLGSPTSASRKSPRRRSVRC